MVQGNTCVSNILNIIVETHIVEMCYYGNMCVMSVFTLQCSMTTGQKIVSMMW